MAEKEQETAEAVPIKDTRNAVEIQQEFFEAMGDADWELYEKKDRRYLLQKLAIAMFGPPQEEGDLKSEELNLQGYSPRETDLTTKVFKKICEQAKYSHNGENIVMSILRVLAVLPNDPPTTRTKRIIKTLTPDPPDYWVNLHTKKGNKEVIICTFHVFCIRRCVSIKPGEKSCRVYIDHDARVYKDWTSYMTENTLPKSVLVVPENGEYKGVLSRDSYNFFNEDIIEMPVVKLTVAPSPALGLKARVLHVTDTTSAVAGIGALVGTLGVFVVPAAAPVILGTAVGVGVATSVYGIVRSSMHLRDRKKHEQEIDLTSPEARSSWINILVSSVGLSFSAAGKLLSWAAAAGGNIEILINALQFLKYTSIATGLVGIVNGLGDMIYKFKVYGETPNSLEVFQFASSLLFFGIGVMSNQTAQEIVQDAQAKTINEMRDTLTSNTKRKMFDKVTAETRRVQGTVKGNAEVIRGLKTIDNKNEFFAKLSKMNKDLNKNKVRISLSSDGSPMFNNQYKVNFSELRSMGKADRNALFAKYGPANVTTKNVPTRIYPSYVSSTGISIKPTEVACYVRPEEIVRISSFILKLSQNDKEFVYNILSQMSADLHDAFLLLCAKLFYALLPEELKLLMDIGEDYMIRFVLFVFNFLKSKVGEIDRENDHVLKIALKELVKHGRIEAETIKKIKEKFLSWLEIRQNINPNDDPRKYDDIYQFNEKYQSGFIKLYAGQVMTVGNHKLIIKAATLEILEERLESYYQKRCDVFTDVCFKIISNMSESEVEELTLINPDEDVLLRVSDFVYTSDITDNLLDNFIFDEIDESVALSLKNDLMEWWTAQSTRKHVPCTLCNGVFYCDK